MADTLPLIFKYTITPSTIPTNAKAQLILTITNNTGDTVYFDGGNDQSTIDVSFPMGDKDTDLVTDENFTGTADPTDFTCDYNGSFFVIAGTPFDNDGNPMQTPLPNGASIKVTFKDVSINKTEGVAQIEISEFVIDKPTGPGYVTVTKEEQKQLDILAYLEENVVGLDQKTTLHWYTTGATHVKVIGFPDAPREKIFDVTVPPPAPGECEVNIGETDKEITYTLIAYTGNGNDPSNPRTTVQLYQSAALIIDFSAYSSALTLKADLLPDNTQLDVDEPVTITQTVQYASSWQFKKPDRPINGSAHYVKTQVVPGQDLVTAYAGKYDRMPDTATYRLTVFGYQDPLNPQPDPFEELHFKIKPVVVKYFKYKDRDANGNLSTMIAETVPYDWPARVLSSGGGQPNILTITQPGGSKVVLYLGEPDTHPQVQYFNLAKDSSNGTFSWVGKNVKSLVLTRPDKTTYNVPTNAIAYGTLKENWQVGDYLLTAVGTDNSTVVSILTVTS
ncbi:hypothetical protein [Chitinophaga sp. Cy-1792]|uniref:hypothetical protein n=1 Tax=Chitinophaga sp. Cy-1792 TaxID=2608339 RepID=UPI001420CC3B|nr:hypothetical protein [Chitinophaga sp. Cy-1792]NIG56679.1 hypothetical protein [Chitinophaga sp. Cy-1792]